MDPRRPTLLGLVLSLSLLPAACDESGLSAKGPRARIDQVEPSCGWEAGWDEIRISTSNFKDDFLVHLPEVDFGPWPALDVIALSSTDILAVTPDGMVQGTVDVTVQSTGAAQTATCQGCFEVTPAAHLSCRVTDWYPRASPMAGGLPVTIRGGPFDPATIMYIRMPLVGQRIDPTRTIITGETAPSIFEGYVDLTIVTPVGSCTLTNGFIYAWDGYCEDVRANPPAADVAGGRMVRLTGVEFDYGPDGTPTVEFGTAGNWVASPYVLNLQDGITLIAETPPWPGPGEVQVRITNGSTGFSCWTDFEFVEAPGCALFRAEPDQGPICGGNLVILRGIHLDPAPLEIWFGLAPVDVTDPAQFLWIDSETVQVRAPAMAGPGEVTYVNPGPTACSSSVAYQWR